MLIDLSFKYYRDFTVEEVRRSERVFFSLVVGGFSGEVWGV